MSLVDVFLSPVTGDQLAQALILASFAFMVLDVLFGGFNAAMKHQFKSSVMREGIGHKCSELAFILVGVIIDAVLSLGADLPLGIEGPVLKVICVGIMLMELMSLFEIWAKMNPKLADMPVFKMLAEAKGEREDGVQP